MEEIVQSIIRNHFSDLTGLTADVSIPVTQSLANEIIRAVLRGNQTIKSCEVSIHTENRVSVQVQTGLLPWGLNLKLKLDRSVDLASFSSPKVRAWLENHQLLGSLGSLFNAFPKGVKLYGNQVVIDLGSFFRDSDQKKFFDLVKSVAIRTEEGKVIFDINIEVE